MTADRHMLERPVEDLPGIGRASGATLRKRGFGTVGALLWLLPRRYEDRRTVTPIPQLVEGERQVTVGIVAAVRTPPGRRRRLEVVLEPRPEDPSGRYGLLRLVWFRVPRGLAQRYERGMRLRVAGDVKEFRGKASISHPEVEVLDDAETARGSGIVPRYPDVAGVAPRTLTRAVGAAAARAAHTVDEALPQEVRARMELPTLATALSSLHHPPADMTADELQRWNEGRSVHHRRLVFEELFLFELALQRRRREEQRIAAEPLVASGDARTRAAAALPFEPTAAQRRATEEIAHDLARQQPMRRLLQGDVGSGKTAVAALAAAQATAAAAQTAFMAPTEVLAEQHYRHLASLAAALGLRLELLVGSTEPQERRRILEGLRAGEVDVVVGTHALLGEEVRYRRLRLVIVDEQHRFGVAQRLQLVEKGGDAPLPEPKARAQKSTPIAPHLLVMTATPIPRSLALVLYGDLEASVLDEMPPGRQPPVTRAYGTDQRERALRQLERAIDAGGRAYVVCPAVERSEEDETLPTVDATYREMIQRFGGDRVAMVHGRLPAAERQQAMERFAAGTVRVLVSTTVIEVGVDVPEANAILIEGAERFGLAQLHQLRGRVGRAGQRSACLLVHRAATEDARARLRTLCETSDGFRIAEQDLRLRGPGELFGRRQAGLGGFRFGDLRRDLPLLERARELARELMSRDPELEQPEHAATRRALAARMANVIGEEAG